MVSARTGSYFRRRRYHPWIAAIATTKSALEPAPSGPVAHPQLLAGGVDGGVALTAASLASIAAAAEADAAAEGSAVADGTGPTFATHRMYLLVISRISPSLLGRWRVRVASSHTPALPSSRWQLVPAAAFDSHRLGGGMSARAIPHSVDTTRATGTTKERIGKAYLTPKSNACFFGDRSHAEGRRTSADREGLPSDAVGLTRTQERDQFCGLVGV